MDTGTTEPISADNPLPEPFQFTASMEIHSIPTDKIDVSTNTTSTEGLAVKASLESDGEMFSTPDNHSGIPLIQLLSQSPHVPGKTLHTASVMTRSKLFDTTKSATESTVSQAYHANVAKINDALSQNSDSNSVDDKLNITSKSFAGQQNLEDPIEHSLEQLCSDSKGVIQEETTHVSAVVIAVSSNEDDEDRDVETTTEITNHTCTDSKDDIITDATTAPLGLATLVNGTCGYISMH